MTDKILLVDDDPIAIRAMAKALAGLGELRFATNGEDALRLAAEITPDLVLLDAEMDGISGYGVLDALKRRPEMIDVPVIFVTSHNEIDFEVGALEAGAADFIAKPINAELVVARVGTQLRVKHMAEQLRRAAATDSLTGVANRRKFDEMLEFEWQRARRHGDPISLLLIDVDHFKLYNDRYGHPKGDASLCEVATALGKAARRTGDLVARCGGEEFAILLPQTPLRGAGAVASRVLGIIQALDITHATSPTNQHLTVSVGVACYDEYPADGCYVGDDRRLACNSASLITAADHALYGAKRAGRDQAIVAEVAGADVTTVVELSRNALELQVAI